MSRYSRLPPLHRLLSYLQLMCRHRLMMSDQMMLPHLMVHHLMRPRPQPQSLQAAAL